MTTRWVIPAATVSLALLWPGNAHAQAWTCWESNTVQWQMIQPDEHYAAGLMPSWADCLAWKDGDPGPEYVWSYGQPTPTTTSAPATTTTVPATTSTSTTVPETTTTSSTTAPTTTAPATTTTAAATTTAAPTTTTTTAPTVPTAAPTTTYQPTTSTSQPNTTQQTASTSQTSTSSSTTVLPVETPPTVTQTTVMLADARAVRAAKVIRAQLAPGVTPMQAQTVIIVTTALQAVSVTRARRR